MQRNFSSQRKLKINNKDITPKDLGRVSKSFFAKHYLGFDLAPFQYKCLDEIIPAYKNRLFTISRNTGKTAVICKTHVLTELLYKPNNPMLYLSRGNDLVKKFVNSVEIELTENKKILADFSYELQDYKRLDNNLRFNQEDTTNSSKSMQYQLEAKSIESSLTGNHYIEIVFDDIEDDRSVLTPHSRQKTKDYINTTVTPLLNPGGFKTAFGTFKHLDDVYNHWINSNTWRHYNAPIAIKMPESWDYIFDENGIAVGVKNIKGDYELLFPARWGLNEILLLIAEIGEPAFQREYQNNLEALQGTKLKVSWIKQCAISQKVAEENGVELIPPLENLEIYQGVDLAIATGEENDYFVVETVGVQRSPQFKIFILDWYRDKLGFPDQVNIMKSLRHGSLEPIWAGKTWNVLLTTLESNAYQLALAQQLIHTTDMHIQPLNSTVKKEIGIVANSTKYQNGLMYVPIDHPEYDNFIREYKDFPKGAHDDILDADRMATSGIILDDFGVNQTKITVGTRIGGRRRT